MDPNLVDPRPRPLGGSGALVGPLAFGCWRFTHADVRDAEALFGEAVDLGLHLVDTADVYGLDWGGAGFGAAEALLGQVLARSPYRRDRIVLATKGGIRPGVPYDSSGPAIRAACEASLRRLGVDHVDLYQIHRPDLFASPDEVADALVALRDEGKIGQLGVSNHTVGQVDALAAALAARGAALATTQPEYSAARLDPLRDGTLDQAQRLGLLPLAWSPLAGGRLATGEGIAPALVGVLDELAEREGTDRVGVALAFVLAHPSRPVAIVGSQRPERLLAAVGALAVRLDRRDLYRIVEASQGAPLP